MNGSIPRLVGKAPKRPPDPPQTVQVMSDPDIIVRRDPILRLPRQTEHIGRLVDHILGVKYSSQLRRSPAAQFERLDAYRHRAAGRSDEE